MLDQIVFTGNVVGLGLVIYSWIHIAAFLLSWVQADLNNPIVAFVNRVTIPMWNWVGSKLSQKLAAFAPIFALMLVIFGSIVLPGAVKSLGVTIIGGIDLNSCLKHVGYYILFGGLYIMRNIFGFVFILSVLWFIFTLVNPPLNNPFVRAVWFIVDPLISPIQRLLPRSQIDFSPLILAIITFMLQFATTTYMIPPVKAKLFLYNVWILPGF